MDDFYDIMQKSAKGIFYGERSGDSGMTITENPNGLVVEDVNEINKILGEFGLNDDDVC